MFSIDFSHKGDFSKTERFFNKILKRGYLNVLERYGREGVRALSASTPKKTGKTAASWSYEITSSNGSTSVIWTNSNFNKGVNIAIILQYGHGTGWGGYVRGIDYINPALKPVFEKMADDVWKEIVDL